MKIEDLNLKTISELSGMMSSLLGGGVKGWDIKLRNAIQTNELRCYRFQKSCNSKIWLKESDVVAWIENICGSAERQIVMSPTKTKEVRTFDE